ncbi:MAG: beta-phosphoglucomutase [Deltaproteobacteria bacterium RIFOXYD12_FULL_50_9]|nr:MAG: beta-phosphoglucomutase [Deltaproteobacteria bacterium RIFOXYD12_FULL_50_9]
MTTLKLVIFDCDGVMFDSKEANRYYYNDLLAHFGHQPMSEDDLEFVHINHVMGSISHIFRHYQDDMAAVDSFRKSLDYVPYLQYMHMEPDLKEFLQFLQANGYQTAISTNRTTTMPIILEMFGLKSFFDMVVTALDVTQPKPHPEALHKILERFQVAATECIYIGDSEIDREHTAALGMRLIAFKNNELAAEYHVRSFREISELPIFAAGG